MLRFFVWEREIVCFTNFNRTYKRTRKYISKRARSTQKHHNAVCFTCILLFNMASNSSFDICGTEFTKSSRDRPILLSASMVPAWQKREQETEILCHYEFKDRYASSLCVTLNLEEIHPFETFITSATYSMSEHCFWSPWKDFRVSILMEVISVLCTKQIHLNSGEISITFQQPTAQYSLVGCNRISRDADRK